METLSREQILDLLARAEAELMRIRISRQPQLLKKPLGLLRQADSACRDVLPRQVYEAKCQQFLLTLSQALEQAILQDDRKNLKEITELAASILNQLYAGLKDDPALLRLARKKKEIVYLPYKAAMWDSMESIWKASVADSEHCHSYVVPIPYADRNPDGTAKEWHNERNLFPSYVPTLDCETFDLEALHPDVIFIHNPYDACNTVTSVDSRFYSDKLKKYTDKLVYVPYFVLSEPQLDYDDPDKKEEVEKNEENIAHFITTPGVLNADLTIVQSEAMKKVYMKVLARYTNATKEYWETHISGLGSPKLDKIKCKKEEFELPEGWQEIIRGKKVVLYNTGLTAMLEHTDRFIEKIKSVLKMFAKRKDVALWWRPHPLLRSTFLSMHPELLDDYDEVVSNYRQEGWGVFDDTSNLNRALAWTDVYYGDASSVAKLYEETGKDVMLEAFPEESSNNFNWKIFTLHGLAIGDNFYFATMNYNALFVFHMNENKLEHFSWLRGRVDRSWTCGGICNLGDSLFIAPASNEEARIVDLSGKTIEKIIVDRDYIDGSSDKPGAVQFYASYIVDGKAWMVPHHGRAIAACDLKNKTVDFYPEIYKLIENHQKITCPFFGNSVVARDGIWIISAKTSQIMQFDIKTRSAYAHKVDETDGKIGYIEYDGENFWLYTIKGVLICWTPEEGEKKKVINPLKLDKDYGGIKYIHGKIWMVAGYQDVFGSYDIKTEKIEIYRGRMNNEEGGIIGASIMKAYGDDLYVLPYYGNMFLRINTRTKKVKGWKLEFNKEIKKEFGNRYEKEFKSGDYEWEDEAIFYILKREKTMMSINEKENVGKDIYQNIMENVYQN